MMPEKPPPVKSSRHRRPEKPSMLFKDGRQQPFVWFPPELLPQYGAAMGAYAGWVYMSLLTHLNRKQGRCYLALETIASETGMSKRKVQSSLKTLVMLGLIGMTMRRPKVSIFEVFDLPERPVNTHDMPITAPESNRHVVPVNRHDVPVNVHDVPVQCARGAYEPEVVEPEVEDQKTTTTTAAPISSNVVEVVEDFAIAQGEEAETTDGSIAGAMAPPWRQFFDAYPTHRCPEKVQAEWNRQQLDSMLPTILEALSWQVELTGDDVLPKMAWVYLRDGRWRDRRSAARKISHAWDEDALHCQAQDCEGEVPSELSDLRCHDHAMSYLESEATEVLAALRECPDDATVDVLEDAIWGLVGQYHRNGGATAVREMLVYLSQDISPAQLTAVFVAQEIGRVVAAHRAQPQMAVLN